jgi:hypothetical protein
MKNGVLALILGLLFCWTGTSAQTVNSFQRATVRLDTPQKAQVKFQFGFDSRKSFLLGQTARISGIRIGFEIDGMDRFGWGFYNLANETVLPETPISFVNEDATSSYVDTVDVNFGFSYNTLYYERVLFKNRKWELSTPFHIGIGKIVGTALDSMALSHTLIDQRVVPVEMSVMASYNIFRWFAIGGGLGYRAIVTSDQQVKDAYNAPIYIIKAKFNFGAIYRGIFKKEKQKENEDSFIEE